MIILSNSDLSAGMAGGKCIMNPGGGFGTVGGHSVTTCLSQIPICRAVAPHPCPPHL